MLEPRSLFGLGPQENRAHPRDLALLFGPPVVKGLSKRAGRVAGTTESTRGEFKVGREAE